MAEFEIKTDYREDTLYMEWIGRLRADNVSQVIEAIKSFPQMVNAEIDCSGLEYIASAGLGGLLVVIKTAQGNGGKVAMKNVSDLVAEPLALTGYDKMVEME